MLYMYLMPRDMDSFFEIEKNALNTIELMTLRFLHSSALRIFHLVIISSNLYIIKYILANSQLYQPP
jgi:hypothetical protein